MSTEPKKRLLDIPMGLGILPLTFIALAVTLVWVWSMDFKNLDFHVLGQSITISSFWPPIILFIWGSTPIVWAKRDWWWRPTAIGCPTSILYIATGVAIYLTKSPLLLLALVFINMVVAPIVEIIKPKNPSARLT
jgi:hypothetical protein